MLRLDYLLMSSVIDQAGDKLEWDGGVWCIKSFANRDNNGMQPVPDDIPVVVIYENGNIDKGLPLEYNWSKESSTAISKWKPDYDKLLEQQNEYDKQQEKPIEEIMINAKEGKMRYFTYGQKIYIKNHDNSEFKFACYHIDGDSILFMFDDGYGHVGIDNVSATPFKDELEIAKDKQIDVAINAVMSSSNLKYKECQRVAKWLQSQGLLSEIILPLKDK